MEKYYIAKIIWQIKIPTNGIASEFDEQLRIVKASDAKNALKKAIQIGHEQEESFINSKGQQVSWTFINVEFIKEMYSFEDGMEICSQTINAPDALQFIKDIHVKSALNTETEIPKLD
jgi:hypothetical protein